MAWSKKVIADHEETAERLTAVMRNAFRYLKLNPSATEGEVKDFILNNMREEGLVMDKPFNTPIVAFGDHATDPHYHPVPGKRQMKPGALVMIDIWGRLRGQQKPYADITWMGRRTGRTPAAELKAVQAVFAARDACLEFVRHGARRKILPTGAAANEVANAALRRAGYANAIKHSTGHILGFISPHGRGRNLNRKNKHPLLKLVGYTIEPGVYISGKLGARSEINFYVRADGTLKVTTPAQRQMIVI